VTSSGNKEGGSKSGGDHRSKIVKKLVDLLEFCLSKERGFEQVKSHLKIGRSLCAQLLTYAQENDLIASSLSQSGEPIYQTTEQGKRFVETYFKLKDIVGTPSSKWRRFLRRIKL
jgi:predicted transcriptional regulator